MSKLSKLLFYQNCIAEQYPFTEEELDFYKEKLNFSYVSANRNIAWSYEYIKKFEIYWNWEILDSNKAVFDKVTLGLLFPDKAELPSCTCFRQNDFCEKYECWVNAERLRYDSDLPTENNKWYIEMCIICSSGILDERLLFDVFMNKEVERLEKVISTVISK